MCNVSEKVSLVLISNEMNLDFYPLKIVFVLFLKLIREKLGLLGTCTFLWNQKWYF